SAGEAARTTGAASRSTTATKRLSNQDLRMGIPPAGMVIDEGPSRSRARKSLWDCGRVCGLWFVVISRAALRDPSAAVSNPDRSRGERMPVLYDIDRDQRVIRTRCVGYVTFPEVADHFRALEQEDDCPSPLDVLLDLRASLTVPSTEQLQAVSQE